MTYKLSDAVRDTPWDLGMGLVIDPNPGARPDIMGDPKGRLAEGMSVAVCRSSEGEVYLAARADDWELAYSAAHEIAECRHGFRHTAEMFEHQAAILSTWCQNLAGSIGYPHLLVTP